MEKGFREDRFSLPVHVEKKPKMDKLMRRKELKMHVSLFRWLAKQELPETFDNIHCIQESCKVLEGANDMLIFRNFNRFNLRNFKLVHLI